MLACASFFTGELARLHRLAAMPWTAPWVHAVLQPSRPEAGEAVTVKRTSVKRVYAEHVSSEKEATSPFFLPFLSSPHSVSAGLTTSPSPPPHQHASSSDLLPDCRAGHVSARVTSWWRAI